MHPSKRFQKIINSRPAQITLVVLTALLLMFFVIDNIVMPLYTRQGSERPIPNLVGMTVMQAKRVADSSRFMLVEQPAKISGSVPEGTIMEQMPLAGSLSKGGRRIRVTPALPQAKDRAPDLVGLDVRDAQVRCKNLDLICGDSEVSYRFSDRAPRGQVIGQKPKAGAEVKPGTVIYITISLGTEPDRLIVPALVEKSLHDARLLIQQAGLDLGNITRKETTSYAAGTVIAQSVRTGEEVQKGTAIDLVVAVTPGKSNKGDDKHRN